MAQSVMSMATKKAAAAQARPSLRRSTARLSVRVQASSGASNRNNNNNEGVTSQGKRDFIKKLALGATTTFGALQGMQKDAMAADNETVASSRMSYSRFLEYLDLDRVKKVDLYDNGTTAIVEAVSPEVGNRIQRVRVQLPGTSQELLRQLKEKKVDFASHAPQEDGSTVFLSLLGNLAFPLVLIGGLFFLSRRNGGGGPGGGGPGNPLGFAKSKAKFQMEPNTGVMFDDVAGVNEAKNDFMEVVEFLKRPEKFTAVGARIPKGVLLVGPPGTGKTLLAKAIAGEAGVPFFSISGSEFVEMFVGVGASRVRDLFKKAKENAPCIVFVDEIDAVGRSRGTGIGGGNDEREQTLNQLLTEMDGFEGNTGIIVVAATNRADILDPALLRPGRFDRQVTVDRPDVQGRVKILEVHSRDKVLSKDVDLEKVARRTPGFTGADLQNLMNEAAIMAARRSLKEISKEEIADALERIIAGPEKKDAVMSDEKRKLVAYHEAGHAIVGALMPEYDPVTKISIVPRGAAGGLTFFAPSEERLESGLYSRSYLENQMCVALGGRIAEELIFGAENVTTGASGDFQQVTRTAKMMVTQMGFSDELGQVCYGGGGGPSFLGAQAGQDADYSGETADIIDKEVKDLVNRAYRRAKDLLQTNLDLLHDVSIRLMETENMDGDEFEKIVLASGAAQYTKDDEPSITVPYQK
mmetsp:Transcript_2441/g.8242  ORF Transcript_2441/g.8242 Transcript_2441/m.8242 type:complete len:695 (-) Transcript_2441:1256-3340(-)